MEYAVLCILFLSTAAASCMCCVPYSTSDVLRLPESVKGQATRGSDVLSRRASTPPHRNSHLLPGTATVPACLGGQVRAILARPQPPARSDPGQSHRLPTGAHAVLPQASPLRPRQKPGATPQTAKARGAASLSASFPERSLSPPISTSPPSHNHGSVVSPDASPLPLLTMPLRC